jgi:hypothetical protein
MCVDGCGDVCVMCVCVVEMAPMAPMAHNYGTKVEPILGLSKVYIFVKPLNTEET